MTELVPGMVLFDYQQAALDAERHAPGPSQRACLYYRTGAGKTVTGLLLVRQWGHTHAVVVCPPSTHPAWRETAARLGMTVECISHSKFRQKGYALSRHKAVIADEFHLFGGHGKQGWKKLDGLARGLKAPLVLASATPNYNDAERVYCIQHVMDPQSVKGGFIAFLYEHCITEQDPFSATPKVLGFHHFKDAAGYLASLPGVHYVPDTLTYQIQDIPVYKVEPYEFDLYGYDKRSHRIMASIIERKHRVIFNTLVDDSGFLRDALYEELIKLAGSATTPLLIFANHSTVADALARSLKEHGVNYAVVTGKTSGKVKDQNLEAFRRGELDVLVGTASLATGTDGLDKVCDRLVILDDTDDDALRRQLIGRIMPRGADGDASKKQVFRFLLQ